MPRPLISAISVIHAHIRRIGILKGAVKHNNRDIELGGFVEGLPVLAGGGSDNAIHPLTQQNVDIIRFALQHLVGIANHQTVIVGNQNILDAAHNLAKKGIGDIRDNQTNHRGALGRQAARRHIRTIAQFSDGRLNALLGGFFHKSRFVNHMRDSRFGYARVFGNIPHGNPSHQCLIPYKKTCCATD